ncbi:hypothetical protein HID58_006704 [Brassica napus]|uniref:Uncharacterized protein n=1 Tax=Brassica napus TaxID=3708 RepID=A0ABQ8ECU4_BRANA|nr:hypothetical protein HID58_006704 [Brassica napus]
MAAAVLMPTISFRDESTHEEMKKKILVKQASIMQSEREISMDPKSIRSFSFSGSLTRNDSFDMVLLPAMSPPRDLDAPMPLPLQPVNGNLPNSTTNSPKQRSGLMRALKDGFKCNALCLYLPGFGKGKPVRSSRKDDSSSFTRTTTTTTSSSSSVTISRTVSVRESTTTTISVRVSMEKFDCSSYASESGGEEGRDHSFNLPSELIKSGSDENDHDDPVSAAFVRFSTSPAISPRLLEATKNFNTFLAAQAV